MIGPTLLSMAAILAMTARNPNRIPEGSRPKFLGFGHRALTSKRPSPRRWQLHGVTQTKEAARRLRQRARDERNRELRALKKWVGERYGVSTKGKPDEWSGGAGGVVFLRGVNVETHGS